MADTATHNSIDTMPPAEQIARDARDRLAAANYTSSVMTIDLDVLDELVVLLVTPGMTRTEIYQWLCERTEIKRSAFFRFADRFEETFKVIWGDYAAHLVTINLGVGGDEQVGDLADFNRRRVQQLIAQELVTARSPADLATSRLTALTAAIRTADRTDLDREDLALRKEDADRRAAESEAKLERMAIELGKLKLQLNEAQTRFDAEVEREKRAADRKGAGGLDDDAITRVRAAMFGGAS